jgi:hypothetical protein
VYGAAADLPDGTAAKRRWAELSALEQQAREAGRGAWSRTLRAARPPRPR